ncbi:MAG TPA: methyltransferase [Polyangiales bacterium]
MQQADEAARPAFLAAFMRPAGGARLASPAARLIERTRHLLRRATQTSAPPPVAMLELLSAGWLSQAIVAAAELGLADAIDAQPRPVNEVAHELGLNADAAGRLLRALAQHGVFQRLPDGRYRATPLSRTLRRDGPSSIRDFALFLGSSPHREHWSNLAAAVRTGRAAIASLRGADFFDYARREPEFGALFGAAMSSLSRLSRDYVLTAYDFSGLRSLVDVGGGEGRLLRELLEHAPDLRGVLFDLPEVIERCVPLPATVERRFARVPGSFFDAWPPGHDAYLLKHVLHDWDDEPARRILARAREALLPSQSGRLLLVEMVLPADATPHPGTLFDLEMLLSVDGRERTRAEFERLLGAEGFELARVIPTASPLSILEASLTR